MDTSQLSLINFGFDNKLYNIKYYKYNNLNIYNYDSKLNTSLVQYAISGTNGLIEVIYPNTKDKEQEKRRENIRECMKNGKSSQILLKSKLEDEVYLHDIGCNSPICPICVEMRKKLTRKKLKSVVSQYSEARFGTFGFKNVTNLTKSYFKEIKMQFNHTKKYLKREGYSFRNYIQVMEIVLHKKGEPIIDTSTKKQIGTYLIKNWNVHFHIIFDGGYIPYHVMKKCFKRATKNSSYVHLKHLWRDNNQIRNKMKALNYVTKYISKMNFDQNDFELQVEYYNAIKKIRFVTTYGIKPLKEEGIYILFLTFLRKKEVPYEERIEIESRIIFFMNELNLRYANPYKDAYDNFLEYGNKEEINKMYEMYMEE